MTTPQSDSLTSPNIHPKSELAFFAASIAALAVGEADPRDILHSVVERYEFDKERHLAAKAQSMGYQHYGKFEEDLIALIGQQMHDLKSCRLTAAERDQRRLIDAL